MTTTTTETQPQVAKLAMPAKDLLGLVKNALVMAGKDDMRPVLTGVYVEIEPGLLRFVTTDSYRLLVQEYQTDTGVSELFSVLLAPDDLTMLVKAFPTTRLGKAAMSNSTMDCGVTFTENEGLNVKMGPQEFLIGTIDGHYVNYRAIMPAEGQTCELDSDGFYLSPRFLADFTKLIGGGAKDNGSIRFRPTTALKPIRFDVACRAHFAGGNVKAFGLIMPVATR